MMTQASMGRQGLNEQASSPKRRAYRMAKRAENVEETRQRIIEAAVTMHETVGPAATTIAGIAETAGVTRLTVYRHFPDDEALYAACSAHWLAGQVLPDPDAWARIVDPADRLRAGLADLYRYYRDGEVMMARIHGEIDHVPARVRRMLREAQAGYETALLSAFPARARDRRLRAVIGHAVSFWTWRSLCREHNLPDRHAVDLMTSLALLASRTTPDRSRPSSVP